MLVLGQKKGPQRITLRGAVPAAKGRKAQPEAFIVMAPITPAMRRRAGWAARQLLGQVDDVESVDFDLLADVAETGSRELIRLGAVEWGGIGDEGGNELPLTPDRDVRMATAKDAARPTGTIDLLLDDEDIFALLEAEYVRPDSLRRAEKNASSASPTGTGGAATRAKTIVGSPASRKAKTTAATNAHTGKTRSNPKRAKASGKS